MTCEYCHSRDPIDKVKQELFDALREIESLDSEISDLQRECDGLRTDLTERYETRNDILIPLMEALGAHGTDIALALGHQTDPVEALLKLLGK